MKLWRPTGEALAEAYRSDIERDADRWYWQTARIQVQCAARRMRDANELRRLFPR